MKHKLDISISKDNWIIGINVSEFQSFLDLDPYLSGTKVFWKKLETECVSACCGIDAYAFWKEDIQNLNEHFDQNEIVIKFEQLLEKVKSSTEEAFKSTILNQIFHKSVFMKLIEHIIKNVKAEPEDEANLESRCIRSK